MVCCGWIRQGGNRPGVDTYLHPSIETKHALLDLLYHACGEWVSIRGNHHSNQPLLPTKGANMAPLAPGNLFQHRRFQCFHHCVPHGVRYSSFAAPPQDYLEAINVHPPENRRFGGIFGWRIVSQPSVTPTRDLRSVNRMLTRVCRYSLCACAAGRLASAVDMRSNEDKSYAYSEFLLWGLGEATSTILVFCAPSIPIMINSARRISKLKLSQSRSWPSNIRKGPSDHRQRPWPRMASDSKGVDEYQRMTEDSVTQLDRLGPDPRLSTIRNEDEQHPLQRYLGIMVTTEIQVETHTETELPIIGESIHPWQDDRPLPRERWYPEQSK